MRHIQATASCEINAPIEIVWEILVGIGNYERWNPFVIQIKSNRDEPIEGVLMDFTVRFPNGIRTVKSLELVTKFSPPQKTDDGIIALWEYDYASFMAKIGMIKATRVQRLIQKKGEATKYFSQEVFNGWGAGLVPIKKVQAGFDAQTEALKNAAEEAAG
ncbi:MAG: SRPBCC domain-containing protein [Chloroflexota bacterium]